jgi:hypothetical protein
MKRLFAMLLPALVVVLGSERAPAATVAPADSVRVEIIEGVPDQSSWDFTPQTPTETYAEPAFGFDTMPGKYSARGLRTDRTLPFLLRATGRVVLPQGKFRLLLRARNAARLTVDDRPFLGTAFAPLNSDGHEEVPEVPQELSPDLRYARPGHFEAVTNFVSDGEPHEFRLEAIVGSKGRRPELGELTVSVETEPGQFRVLGPKTAIPYTEDGWNAHASAQRDRWQAFDRERRRALAASEDPYWRQRHEAARTLHAPREPAAATVDAFIDERLQASNVPPARLTDDAAFLRRLALDTIGTVPSPAQIDEFEQDRGADRRARAIDRMLAHPGWADHWVSYWQDVLAENPGILKPMLNNTGPFRWWLHEAFTDNTPMDRFATDLILMEGSTYYGGPAGFGMASENDVPMAQKAQIVAQAFLGMQLQCARCHDAPYHDFKQQDLFSLAAMLKRGPQVVPASSSIPTNANVVVGRRVKVTLAPGAKVAPAWPFTNVMRDDLPEGMLRDPKDSRERLAALITDARNERFARVLANRVWQRYLGHGLVEPVDDWEDTRPSHPGLLGFLARELATHDYDLKHLARVVLNSQAYQRRVRPEGSRDVPSEPRLFASPSRRRLSAEQIVDSLFAVAGKPFHAEEMNMDVDGRRPVKDFNNLGTPGHAWEFTSLSNERDRPALAMPHAQMIADCLTAFGWRESRQSPQTVRDHAANALQPASLAQGLLNNGRIVRLSDDSALTELCLLERPLHDLIHGLFRRVLSRAPTSEEMVTFHALLEPGYDQRIVTSAAGIYRKRSPQRPVSWSNHLHPEATRIKQELEREARAGDPPTERLRRDWRERMEDAVWALVNSPEFIFVP